LNKIAIDVVDQQQDFIVVYKPANVDFHDDKQQLGFFNQVKLYMSINELYPVHRLDKITSGLVLIATNINAARHFQQLFEAKKIEKYYLAISDLKPSKKQGLIKGDMAKSRRGMWKLLRSQKKPAISQFFSFSLGQGKRLFLVKPHTGKTHQIRVALKSIGAPIMGDPYYNHTSTTDRGYLHAFALRFIFNQRTYQYLLSPTQGIEYKTDEMTRIVNELGIPWQLDWPTLAK
jgi:tRNA pseudouridine32 synthase/23S rRNA pseudouridine746 synthase